VNWRWNVLSGGRKGDGFLAPRRPAAPQGWEEGINRLVLAVLALWGFAFGTLAAAEKRYGPGAADAEIKIGQTMPCSGAASAYGTIGKAEDFAMINDRGGINRRKIKFLILDNGYRPPKTVEQIRELVEQEQVLLLFQTMGTATNNAVHKYVNDKKV
jgi:branched-chain amino acid transport system substrate-binding protein